MIRILNVIPMLIPESFLRPWVVGAVVNAIALLPLFFTPKKLLTPLGIAHAWVLAIILWGSFQSPQVPWYWLPGGYVLMVVYFILGSAVTRVGMAQKEALGIAEKRDGARGPENVWGSAFVAAVCALGFWIIKVLETNEALKTNHVSPWYFQAMPLLLLAFVASMATKLSDTCASEIGKAYGQRTFLITTLQPVPRGTEGAVSLEGTLAGIVASVVIALVGWAVGMIPHQNPVGILLCVIAAFVATNLESVIGATIQTKYTWLTNELVNVINTLIGAVVAAVLGWFFYGF
jgi:uncharacterized protein (TIGR00297 family)